MKMHQETLILRSNGVRVTYHEISKQVKEILERSGVQDTDFGGDECLQVYVNRIIERCVPREMTENMDYRYPGPKHVDFLMNMNDPMYPADPGTILNGDAHIRGSLFGCSETFIVKDGKMLTGTVGYMYFVDWDQNRVRDRKCHVMVMGE